MMAYQFTFTKRFQKHFKDLTAQEKSSFKTNCSFWPKILCTHPSARNASREPGIYLSAASTWTSALSGIMRVIRSLFLLMLDTMTF